MAEYRRGDRVKYVGIHHGKENPVGVVRGVSRAGVTVHWFNGSGTYTVHPEDVRPVQRQEKV